MEWSKEAEDLDRKVETIIKSEKKPEKLLEFFPDAKSMVEFSNEVYPYPHRRNSILAMIVETNDLDVLNNFWETYFPNDDKDLGLKRKFLQGTNAIGQKMNRKYFEADLSPMNKLKAEWFKSDNKEDCEDFEFKINHYLVGSDNRNGIQKNRELMYDILSYLHESLAIRCWENDENDENENKELIRQIKRIQSGKKRHRLVEEVEGVDNKFVLSREFEPFSNLVLRKNDINAESNLLVELKNLDMKAEKSLNEQVFEQLDFPEVHYWAKEAIMLLQKTVRHNYKKINQQNLTDFFELYNGILMIDRYNDFSKRELEDSNSAIAYCGVLDEKCPVVGFHAEKMKYSNFDFLQVVIPHEFTHAVDRVKVFDGETDRLSDMDVVKFAFMATYLENEIKQSPHAKIVNDIFMQYDPSDYEAEFVAKVMENRNFKDNKLLKNMLRLVVHYNKAKLDKNEGFITNMAGLMKKKLPHYEKVKNLNADFMAWQKAKKVVKIVQNKIKTGKCNENDVLSYQYIMKEREQKFFRSAQFLKRHFAKQSLGEVIENCLRDEFHRLNNQSKKKGVISILTQKCLEVKRQLLK